MFSDEFALLVSVVCGGEPGEPHQGDQSWQRGLPLHRQQRCARSRLQENHALRAL